MSRGFEKACEISVKHLESISDRVNWTEEDVSPLLDTAMTTLGSKIINRFHEQMAQIAVDAVVGVADLKRRDVNFDLIKVPFDFLLSCDVMSLSFNFLFFGILSNQSEVAGHTRGVQRVQVCMIMIVSVVLQCP